ncbi:hypothetical protein EEB14_55855 [Rhodococcus sp. WS4]|nr:hypothetical protein EEB14_55855 [Rhodococcus sp. WS4]
MKFEAATSCPTGIAHTYMAAELLEQGAARSGHEIHVETQRNPRRDAGRFWLRATRLRGDRRGRRAMACVPNPSRCARKSSFSMIFQPQEKAVIS